MKKKFTLGMILIFLIAGCGSSETSLVTPLPPVSRTRSVTESISPDMMPTVTFSPLPSATSTNISNPKSTDSCFEIVDDEISMQKIANGTVLVGGGYNYDQSLLDLSTSVKYEIETQTQCAFCVRWAISPDNNLLTGIEEVRSDSGEFEKTILWIFNARAEILKKITLDLPGLYDIRWLDNENIILHTEQTSKDGSVMLFNPFTRTQHYVSNDMPDFYAENYFFPTLGWLTEYSPDLEWGVYFGVAPNGQLGYVIRDFINKKTIWQFEDNSGEYQKPEWSPKGDEVAVAKSGNIHLVNRDGKASPILDENQQNQVSQISWSPDGSYISFWNFNALMIYDNQNGEVYDTCFKSDIQFPLTWSPDSRQFAIPDYRGQGGTLVDVEEQTIYKLITIPDTVYPQGWMNSMP